MAWRTSFKVMLKTFKLKNRKGSSLGWKAVDSLDVMLDQSNIMIVSLCVYLRVYGMIVNTLEDNNA